MYKRQSKYVSVPFPEEGLLVMLLGADGWSHQPYGLAGSEYLEICHNLVMGRPYIKLDLEKKVQELCREAITRGLVRSAHDCSEGGLAVALAECSCIGSIGFISNNFNLNDWEADLFGESQSRIIISCRKSDSQSIIEQAQMVNVPIIHLGTTTDYKFKLGEVINTDVSTLTSAWSSALPGK